MNCSRSILCGLVVAAVAPLAALTAEGVSAVGVLETIPPDTGTLVAPATASFPPISLTFSDVSDADSTVVEVQLWFRTDSGSWAASSLTEATSSGSFLFVPPGTAPGNHGTYHFQLVAIDELGNASASPVGFAGVGQAATDFDTTASVGNWWVLE